MRRTQSGLQILNDEHEVVGTLLNPFSCLRSDDAKNRPKPLLYVEPPLLLCGGELRGCSVIPSSLSAKTHYVQLAAVGFKYKNIVFQARTCSQTCLLGWISQETQRRSCAMVSSMEWERRLWRKL